MTKKQLKEKVGTWLDESVELLKKEQKLYILDYKNDEQSLRCLSFQHTSHTQGVNEVLSIHVSDVRTVANILGFELCEDDRGSDSNYDWFYFMYKGVKIFGGEAKE